MNSAVTMDRGKCLDRAREVLDIEMEGIRAVRDGLGDAFVAMAEKCLEILDGQGKIVFCGVGKSGHIGRKLAATLSSTGSPAVFMHPVEAVHGDLGLLSPNDLLVALSYSGETDEVLAVLPAAKRIGVPIVAVTGDAESRLGAWSDLSVAMPVPREACPFNLAPTTTTTALLALGDALAVALLECRRFTPDAYAKLHPAGAIGRSVTLRVTDVMRTGERLAKVGPEVTVREALLAMTSARGGSVVVVTDDDRLAGIFTDGDFRRAVTGNSHVLEQPVASIMTPDPVCIRDTAMAVELVRVLETHSVDDIPVVDGCERLIGLVDISDLPRFKVM